MNEQLSHDAEHRLAVAVKDWLACEYPPASTLVEWLQGFNLPSDSYGLRPYQWLMRALPHNHRRVKAKRLLAERLAQLLAAEPDTKPMGALPLELLENLFLLCGSLERPDELAESLHALYQRNCSKPSELMADPALRSALRSALTFNQVDDRLRPVWERLLKGEQYPCITGNPYAGFEGMLRKPASADMRGKPDLDAIGGALLLMAGYLDGDKFERSKRFDRLIESCSEVYGKPSDYWKSNLLREAIAKQWPQWAVLRLPSLCLVERDGESYKGFLWHPIYDLIASNSKWKAATLGEHLAGELVESTMSEEAANFVNWVTPEFDSLRLRNPWPSARAAHATAIDTCNNLADLIQVFYSERRAKVRFQKNKSGNRKLQSAKSSIHISGVKKSPKLPRQFIKMRVGRRYQRLFQNVSGFDVIARRTLRNGGTTVSSKALATV